MLDPSIQDNFDKDVEEVARRMGDSSTGNYWSDKKLLERQERAVKRCPQNKDY